MCGVSEVFKFGKAVLPAFMICLAQGAGAATLDFVNFIDNVVGERAVEDKGANPNNLGNTFTVDGLELSAFGYLDTLNLGTPTLAQLGTSPFAYLDKGDAGIGVCKVINSNSQCNPGSDDNVTSQEVLGLLFEESIFVESFTFRDEKHKTNFDASDIIGISFDSGQTWTDYALTPTIVFNQLVQSGDQMLFAFRNEQFYISGTTATPVPLPPALPLMLLGFGALAFRARSGRRAA